jgi:hypothetical protein
MVRAARHALLLACAFVCAPRAARAESGESPFHLDYVAAPEGCPGASDFVSAVRARTERTRLAQAGESAVTVAIRIEGSPGAAVRGRLDIREPDGTRQERVVESATCAEVANALALVVALYLDPDATASPAAAPATPRPTEPRPVAAAEQRRVEEAPRAPPVRFGGGAGLGLLGGVGPSVAPLARAFGEAALVPSPRGRSTLRVSIDGATTEDDAAAGSQRYSVLAGAVRLCPFDVRVVRSFFFGACGAFQAGVRRAASEGVVDAQVQDRAWLAPHATAHATLGIGPSVTLELEGGVAVPLVRTRFFLGPDVTVWRTPAAAPAVNAAISFAFP